MKKFSCFLVVMIFMLLMTAGCSSNVNDEKANEEQTELTEQPEKQTVEEATSEDMPAFLSSGSEEVIISLLELKANIETESENTEQIQTTGKDLEESWDSIEKQVEEQHPVDYKNIEESLYPLIAEIKKDQSDVEKIKQLTNDTTEKMRAFKEKIASASS
ncbi:hypothetical protein ABG775_11575 [Peribacillus simplex]|uniref:hypothetical protein n=1 Tax=Peribacillus TaxID=2675229 RepID=UPI00177C46A9|nr:hypothetical protein [Brevibacillus sp. JNUCC-41]QOS89019.1 hypothetical protein JNUCC41_19875 [Brevibacillus sp. JNUCC-41]